MRFSKGKPLYLHPEKPPRLPAIIAPLLTHIHPQPTAIIKFLRYFEYYTQTQEKDVKKTFKKKFKKLVKKSLKKKSMRELF